MVFPGPGSYNQAVVKENSQSILSNYNSFGGQSIGKQHRPMITEQKGKVVTPGPGSYQLPSDFGHYANKDGNLMEGSKATATKE